VSAGVEARLFSPPAQRTPVELTEGEKVEIMGEREGWR